MTRRRIAAALVVGAISASAWIAVAHAGPSSTRTSPPITTLHAGTKGQRGLLGSSCWSHPDGGGGSTGVCADTGWQWPPAKQVVAGRRARVVLHFSERPKELDLDSWREIDPETSQPVGDPVRMKYSLRARRRDGRVVAWVARFRLPSTTGPFYLDAFARWTPGDATYTFHLKLT
jgi:hypothetical protein